MKCILSACKTWRTQCQGGSRHVRTAKRHSAFVKTACPAKTEQLQYWVVTQSGKHGSVTLLNKLVALLGRLDKTDGVSIDVEPAPKGAKHSHGQPAKAIAAAATVVDRKRKHHHDKDARASKYGPYVAPSWVNDNTLCFKCKGRGHMGRDPACPKLGVGWHWIPLDSGASCHLTGHAHDLHNTREISPPKYFTVADGRTVTVGDLHIQTLVKDGNSRTKYYDLVIPNVFYVPSLPITLLSVFRLVQAGNTVLFDSDAWTITQGKNRRQILRAVQVDGIYEVVTLTSRYHETAASVPASARSRSPTKPESLLTCTGDLVISAMTHAGYWQRPLPWMA
ncbi:hypothetical protein PR002_g4791 [Phytophthora rubi]|uniref:Retrovirus-related Pol polyprotein from transposon TNT 1-94-like beta-barrel domain-containing protein n=1 Tax=Phytophthora rubi TaxID=129364 RepID=A0A6A3N5R9_9STRA|nr:hypothetical protein PR002_g4791 [Phytophthora rubi]